MQKQRTKQIASTTIFENCDAKNNAVVPKTATKIEIRLNIFFIFCWTLLHAIYFDICFLLHMLKGMCMLHKDLPVLLNAMDSCQVC
jgi:hypothetical protein